MDDIEFHLAAVGEENPHSAAPIDRLGERFEQPLVSAGVDITERRKEFIEQLEHSTQFISLSTLSYKEVWWRLFHALCASQWTNILTLAKLIFSLPSSNGKLERMFSMVVIKSEKGPLSAIALPPTFVIMKIVQCKNLHLNACAIVIVVYSSGKGIGKPSVKISDTTVTNNQLHVFS